MADAVVRTFAQRGREDVEAGQPKLSPTYVRYRGEPAGGFEIRGARPLCGSRYVWVRNGDERPRYSRQQGERGDVSGPHDREVAAIESCDFGDAQTLRDRDD